RWFGGRVAWLAGDKTKAQTLLTEARSLAASKATSDSVSSEGDTASGAAMTAEGGARLSPILTRWRSVNERSGDIEEEYAAH
ncbi:MAG: hypothetical protein GY930_12595, partial [bacterium]|nr:hypothetical protein [bacterium]